MSDRTTRDYVTDPGWLPPPTPGTAAARLIEESEAEVHAPTSGTGERVLEFAKGRIERSRS